MNTKVLTPKKYGLTVFIYITFLLLFINILIPLKSFALSPGLIKSTTSPTIYYLSSDGNKYTFPNQTIFLSWYKDFSSVMTISPDLLNSYPINGNINIKTNTEAIDPSLYATKIINNKTPDSTIIVEPAVPKETTTKKIPVVKKNNITIKKDYTSLITTYTSFVAFPDKLDTRQKRANVQLVLNKFMNPSPFLVIDGVIGKKTIEATKSFQSSVGLVVDGKIGPITRKALEDIQKEIKVCSQGDLFNTITGELCNLNYPPGCTAYKGFSVLTGLSCIKSGTKSRSREIDDPTKRIKPVVTAFTTISSTTSFNITIDEFTATDNYLVTGYIITESSTPPNLSSNLWSLSPPTTYNFFETGLHYLHAWAKDNDGNISLPVIRQVNVDPLDIIINSPTYESVQPNNNVELNFTPSENPSLCWYDLGGLDLSNGTIPSNPNDPIDEQYQYPLDGCVSKTITLPNDDYVLNLYVKNESGNFGFTSVNFKVDTNAPPDTTIPTVTSFTIPSTSTSLNLPISVSISSFTATDDIGVVGYLITESPTTPEPDSILWNSSKPIAYTFTDYGTYTLYAWAKDAQGNVSLSLNDSIEIIQGSVLGASTYHFTQKLKYGSNNNEVKELQKLLISKGYLKIKTPTTYFGPLTLNALKAYQKDNNLTPDGIMGPKTRGVMNK